MTIQFNNIPPNIRVPLWYAEVNPAQTPYQSISRLLLIGQMLSGGSATAEVPIHVTGNPEGLFGANSMLADMYRVARLNAPFQEIWCLPVADLVAGVTATGTITCQNAPPAQATTISVWIAGVRVRTVAYADDTDVELAARLAAEINSANYSLPCTAAVGVNVGTDDHIITLTARHKGVQGNTIRLEHNYYGNEGPTSADLLALTQFSSGTGDPEIEDALAALGDEEYDFIACPYSDAVNLGYVAQLLNGVSGRWSPFQQLYGHYFCTKFDTVANLGTYGNTLNDEHISIMGVYNSPSPSWQWAAALGGIAAAHLQAPPELSRPLQTLDMLGIKAPKLVADRPNITSRQALYYDGISSYHVERDGTVSIDRLITTYQLNEWGSPDPSWLDVNTLAQTMYAIRYLRQKVTSHWGRAALADENPFNIQGLATPKDVRATIVHGYRELAALAVVENVDEFEARLIVERNQVDANRLDVLLPADVVNQLRIIAVNYISHLQYGNA